MIWTDSDPMISFHFLYHRESALRTDGLTDVDNTAITEHIAVKNSLREI